MNAELKQFFSSAFSVHRSSLGFMRHTLSIIVADQPGELIVKQCERLARVREVRDVTSQPHIEREMALIDVSASAGAARQEVLSLVSVFRAKVVDISHTRMVIEGSGNREKVEAFVEMLRPLGINDITRTGYIAIGRLSNEDEEQPALSFQLSTD